MDIKKNITRKQYSNYSKENGKLNINNNINYFTIEKEDNYCPKCETLASKCDIYCKNCGAILENVKSKRERFINQEKETSNFKNILSSFDLKRGLKSSLLTFGILFIFSLIIKIILIEGNNEISRYVNPIHIILFSNLCSMDVIMSLFMNSSQSSIHIGFLPLLILPVISFILPYILFMKKNNTSFMAHMKNSLCTSIIYAIGLGILAKISEVGINLSNGFNQYGFGQYSYGISVGFNVLNALINGFIISFVSLFLMGLKKEYEKENNMVYMLKLAMKIIGAGYVLILCVLFLLHFANINYIYELGLNNYTNDLSSYSMLSQIAIYFWAFANLIPIYLGNNTLWITSLFTSGLSLELILILVSLIALSSLIFIITGCKLENKYKSENIKPVIKFSILYAIIMGAIGLLTTIYIGDNAANILSSLTAMQMGFSVILGMILSFVYSFIITLIGYKLNIFNMEEEDEGHEII